MPINAGPEYFEAEKEYLNAVSLDDRIYWIEEMIRTAPKHKGSENLLSGLKTRLKKFREKAEKSKKRSGGKKGIRKEGYQFALVGKTNSGKSLLLSRLTNAQSLVANYKFTTKEPEVGTFEYDGVKAQVVDIPSVGGENFDSNIANTADCLLIVVDRLDDLDDVLGFLERARGKRFAVVNKADLLNSEELRKLVERMKSKRINGVIVSSETEMGIDVLRQLMFREMGVVRIYTKEPGKERTKEPIVLKEGATIKDVAECILKGFSGKVKETRLTGPSGKFPNQKVGLSHRVKDLDVVEFHT